MDWTVFLTVVTGVTTFVVGQIVLKLFLDPVQKLRMTIGCVAHCLVERANVIANPGVPRQEVMTETSRNLRTLSAELEAHLYSIPRYRLTARVFGLPCWDNVLKAGSNLIGLSNSLFEARANTYEVNSKRVESIRDALGIYQADSERWPRDINQ